MSRSYKKNPYVTDHSCGTTKQNKRLANHAVRRRLKSDDSEDAPSRIQHKKMTESWNICDYRWRMTREEAIHWYEYKCDNPYIKKRYPTLKSYLNYWEKCHRRK